MRNASVAPIVCLNSSGTDWLDTGPFQVSSVGERADIGERPVARACSALGSAKAPLTRCPLAVALGSAIESAASPALEITLAVVLAV